MRNAVMVSLFVLALVSPGCRKKDETPETPTVPSGPLGGLKDTAHNFTSTAIDPDGDSVSLRFCWGDGDTSDWSSFALPGESITMSHSWSMSGTHSITAQGMDKKGDFSSWSDGHSMEIAPGLKWSKTFDSEDYDCGQEVQQTSDGGYVIVGNTSLYGESKSDIWLIKTDANGSKVWDRTFGGTSSDLGYSVQQTSDGGYVIGGSTRSYGAGNSDAWLVKTDGDGNEEWSRTFGETGYDGGVSVRQTSDGGYVVAGRKEIGGRECFWLVKSDAGGNTQWDRTYETPDWEWNRFCSVRQTSDGGYVAVGLCYVSDPSLRFGGIWLVKTDADGNMIWDKLFSKTTRYIVWSSVQQTSDGGYIVAGTKAEAGNDYDVWLIKTDANGDKVWDKTYGGDEWDEGLSVQQTVDGGYVVAGYTRSSGAGSQDFWLIKTDADGNKVWDATFGGTDGDCAHSVQQTSDNGYVMVGGTQSYGDKGGIWLVKVE